jgi:type III secretion system FlhB-like substrate exporter
MITNMQKLRELQGIISHTCMVSEGMVNLCNQIDEKQYINIAGGTFPLLSTALNTACELVNDFDIERAVKTADKIKTNEAVDFSALNNSQLYELLKDQTIERCKRHLRLHEAIKDLTYEELEEIKAFIEALKESCTLSNEEFHEQYQAQLKAKQVVVEELKTEFAEKLQAVSEKHDIPVKEVLDDLISLIEKETAAGTQEVFNE